MGEDFDTGIGDQVKNIVEDALSSKNFQQLGAKVDMAVKQATSYFPDASKAAAAGRAEYERRKAAMNASNPENMDNMANAASGHYTSREAASGNAPDKYRYNYTQNFYNTRTDINNSSVSGKSMRVVQAQTKRSSGQDKGALQAQDYDAAIFGKPTKDAAGKVMLIFGILGDALFGLLSIPALITAAIVGRGTMGLAMIPFGALVCCGVLTGIGIKNLGVSSRFKVYRSMVAQRKYASISDLASRVGKSNERVLKDVKELIADGAFRQGHLDEGETTLIVTDELYAQYEAAKKQAEELKAAKEKEIAENAGLSDEVKGVLKTGGEYIEKIRAANEALPGEEISAKLTRLELIISRIFARVKEQPSQASKLDQFMRYYLPTTWKLVEAYKEMDDKNLQGETVSGARQEILSSLDSICDAYERLLDSMFEEKALDVSTDISVMKAMLKQDGLSKKDFETDDIGGNRDGGQ